MKAKRVLLIMAFLLFLMGFSGGQPTTATTELTEECKAEIKAVIVSCANQCPHSLRCFIRCIVENYPTCAL